MLRQFHSQNPELPLPLHRSQVYLSSDWESQIFTGGVDDLAAGFLKALSFFFFFNFNFYFFMTAPMVYGSSWAGDWVCDLQCGSGNARYFNPLGWAGDRTCTSTATRAAAVRFLTHCSTEGTPLSSLILSVSTPYTHHRKRLFIYLFWPHLRYAEVPGPGIEPTPQQSSHQVLNC